MRPRQRTCRRSRTAALGLALCLLATVWAAQSAAALHSADFRPANYTEPAGGHDGHSGGGNPSPSAGSSPTASEHDADAHVDLPQGNQEWSTPDLIAQGALVRVETVADVYVALHHFHVENYGYPEVGDPQAVASGAFVNAQGLVITSKGALYDDEKQIERFATWGINKAFVDAKFLKELPDDPFARTTITGATKGELADTPPTDPAMNDRLQDCYDWKTSHHCAVFVVMHQKIVPSVQDKGSAELEGLAQSDARVAAVSTQPRGITPLTLQLANPEPGAKYWVVSSRGVNEEPLVGTGTLTDSEQDPISAADLAKWDKEFGDLAEGAPVVSARGDLVAFLGTAAGSDELAAVSASHISNDLRTFGLTRDSSPVDAQFQDGLELFEAAQFAAAVPKLEVAVQESGGQRVARDLLARAEQKAGSAEDLSDEADVLAVTDQDEGWSGLAIAVFSALVILVLIGVGIAVAMSRRHDEGGPENQGDEEADPGTPTGGPTSSSSNPSQATNPTSQPTNPSQATNPGQATNSTALFATGTTDVKSGEEPTLKRGEPNQPQPQPLSRPSGGFCRQCGTQLSPGDRFCYSCGAPSSATVSKG
ncbi:zinc ribbon domain-containing protein [Kineosporia babensis]|uniref:Zinc ribbon domain-containing protein n=1 Tax=Kineosporia babensis TaxID=499548 RepID=A0A9X1NEB5_9ACTN|nr:zinc ribbon domain-containing protein [Kineosporia babensis]MCD5312181.1 zinc ribbon domain-containing protein [Kineosporia babensis]